MDSGTGQMYPSRQAALDAGVLEKSLVEMFGEPAAIKRVSRSVKAQHQAEKRRKAQRASRKKNR